MQGWQLVAAILGAVLAGAAIPVLLQLRATLRTLERAVADAGPAVAQLARSAEDLTGFVDELRSTLHVAGAIGSAVSAAVHAFRGAPGHDSKEDDHGSHAAETDDRS